MNIGGQNWKPNTNADEKQSKLQVRKKKKDVQILREHSTYAVGNTERKSVIGLSKLQGGETWSPSSVSCNPFSAHWPC